ncbi:ABC transporter substrate-binding protein [Fusobacterium gonidiaformans]|uniref:ABC transporter substrate-binding protein n=1 Tax=Fusobacterium gonidiaformans TaxID=849 RepID=UPI00307D1EE0
MYRKLFVAFWITILFVSCGLEKVQDKKMKVGILSIADSGALFVAEKEQLFLKNGLDVELIPFGSAAEQSRAMEAGELDAMMTDAIVQNLVNQGENNLKEVLVALGDTAEHGKFLILASPTTEHNSLKNLSGAKLGISENTMMEFLVDSYFSLLNLEIHDVEKVNIPSLSLRMEMLLQGKIDLAILPEPLGDFAVLQGAKIVLDDTKLNENLSQSIIVFREAYIEKNFLEVKKFVKSYSEAAKMINEAPDKYKDYIFEMANIPEILKSSYRLPYYSIASVTDRQLFDKMQNWMIQKKLLTQTKDYSSSIDSRFIDIVGEENDSVK